MAPSVRDLKSKLGWKPGQKVLLLNLPAGLDDPFATVEHATAALLPKSKAADELYDLVLAFTIDQAALRNAANYVLPRVNDDSRVWLAYPKLSGAINTDLTRDHGWQPMFDAGWIVVSIVSIDSTWSAVRFRPRHLVKSNRC